LKRRWEELVGLVGQQDNKGYNMTISAQELSKAVAKETARLILPRMKKFISEEVERQFLISEAKNTRRLSEGSIKNHDSVTDDWDNDEEVIEEARPARPTRSAKKILARRGQSREEARQKYEAAGGDASTYDLIMDTEIPDELTTHGPAVPMEESAGTIKASDVRKGDNDIAPEEINYDDLLGDI